jgi:hypothetical protein
VELRSSSQQTWFLRSVISPKPKSQDGGQPFVGYPRLLIQYIRRHLPYLEAVSSNRNLRIRHTWVQGLHLKWSTWGSWRYREIKSRNKRQGRGSCCKKPASRSRISDLIPRDLIRGVGGGNVAEQSTSLISYPLQVNIQPLSSIYITRPVNHSLADYSVRKLIHGKQVKKNGVFWDVTPCGSCKNRRFGT